MNRLELIPEGWRCTLAECPPGHFVYGQMPESVGFKTEYKNENNQIEAYNEAGEFLWCGRKTEEGRRAIIVQPVRPEWREA